SMDREMFEIAKLSGKPIIRTRYFLNNPEKFFIRNMDLSGIRMIKQPDMRILGKLKHLKTLKLNNNRSSGEFDISALDFGEIPDLEILYLKNCSLNALTSKMFTGGTKLRIIHVEGNPIQVTQQGGEDLVFHEYSGVFDVRQTERQKGRNSEPGPGEVPCRLSLGQG
ncbi:hypothetical protein LCGC14_2721740, partial [marine sediment metagenome]